MATWIVFLNNQATVEDQVVEAVRRDHPNPAKLEGSDGNVMFVNSAHVTSVGLRPSPAS